MLKFVSLRKRINEFILHLLRKEAQPVDYINGTNTLPPPLSRDEEKKVFEKSGITVWECRNCGHVVVGTKAPKVCPVCNHPQSFFEVRKENY